MHITRTAALALAMSLAALPAAAPSRAAGVPPYVGQHQFVTGNIANAQRRNNAAISHVQSNIRSSQRNRF